MDDFDILNPDVYGHGDPARNGLPLDQYAALRERAPCYRQAIADDDLVDWTWVLTRHEDVLQVDRDHKRFVSGRGVTLRNFEPTLVEHGGKPAMITMDGADHVRNRRIVGRGFTPPVVRAFDGRFREICTQVLDKALAEERVDFVEAVACELPLQAICDLMGVPDEDRADVLRWSNAFSVPTDPDYAPSAEEVFAAVDSIWSYGVTLAERRRTEPGEDLMSKVAAAYEHEHLDVDELMGMTLLLAGAGNETTRNALSHGLHALLRNPDQMALLREDRDAVIDSAVEEVLRYASPVINFRRTAAEPVELHGQAIEEGDRVTIMFAAANFDPEVFPDPERFDLTRTPNPHLAFGTGPHVCLGAAVARLEIKVLFEELLDRTTDIRPLGPISYVRDSFLRGVKHLPVHLVPRAA
jgi:cholest-4-en-3-one 26-monooxygenase